jgi:hypothetical protein
MTIYELHLSFATQLDKITSSSYPEIPIEQRDFYLNLGVERFIKQRYGGTNPKGEAFEQTQKRVDDLSDIVRYATINPTGVGFIQTRAVTTLTYPLPADYWFSILERVNLISGECPQGDSVWVTASSHNEVNWRLADPFNRPKKDRVFRVMGRGVPQINTPVLITLFHDVTVTPTTYTLGYVGQFLKLAGQYSTNQPLPPGQLTFTHNTINPLLPNYWTTQQFWFNPQSQPEIVNLAVQACLEAIESPRYGSFSNQVNSQE